MWIWLKKKKLYKEKKQKKGILIFLKSRVSDPKWPVNFSWEKKHVFFSLISGKKKEFFQFWVSEWAINFSGKKYATFEHVLQQYHFSFPIKLRIWRFSGSQKVLCDCSHFPQRSFKMPKLAWNFIWKFHGTFRVSFYETSKKKFYLKLHYSTYKYMFFFICMKIFGRFLSVY